MGTLREEVRAQLLAAGLSPSKKLGQNFMVDTSALNALIETANPCAGDRILEIGPGTGILTKRLVARGAQVLAVELDRGMAQLMREQLVPLGLQLLEGDVLASKNALNPELVTWTNGGPWSVAANLPYDISIPFILNCLALPQPPQKLVVTVQLEAAERLCAESGTKAWGASAAVAQAAGRGRIVRKLPPRCFFPPPRVDSAILEFTPEHSLPVGFAQWCRSGFAYRRKRVSRALRDMGVDRDAALAVVADEGLAEECRWEDLTVDQLRALHAQLSTRGLL